jgi:hypothetical protein
MTTMTITPASARSLKNHVSIGQSVRNSLSMAARGLIKMRRTPEQLIDVTVQPIVFTVMFTYIFGGAIAGSVADYLPFLLPGILVQTVITTSVVTGVQLREDMDKGVFDRFRSLPIARVAPLAGALLGDTVRYALATTITFATGYIMGYRPACSRPACSSSPPRGRSAGSSRSSASRRGPRHPFRASRSWCSSRSRSSRTPSCRPTRCRRCWSGSSASTRSRTW